MKQKLQQKASGNANEETVLLKAFKYFDLNNNGSVEPDEFAKAVEKIGIMIPTRQVSAFRAAEHSSSCQPQQGTSLLIFLRHTRGGRQLLTAKSPINFYFF